MIASVFGSAHSFFHSATWDADPGRAGSRSSCSSSGRDRLLGLQGRPPPDRRAAARRGRRRCSARSRRSSARSSTCSSARPSTSRTCASASSRSRRSRPGSAGADDALRGLRLRRSSPTSSSARSARRSSARPARDCSRPLEPAWQVCPYCETPVGVEPARRSSRQRQPRQRRTPQPLSRISSAADGRRAHADPGQAGRGRARPRGRDRRALRAARGSSCARRGSSSPRASSARRTTPSTREKPFFGELVDFITSGPTLAFVLEGEGVIATARKTIGATNPAEADPGSLRGELRARDAEQPRARLRLARVGRARDRALVPRRARLSGAPCDRSPDARRSCSPPPRRSGGRSWPSSASPSRSSRPPTDEQPGGDPLEHAAGKARSVDGGGPARARRRHRRRLRAAGGSASRRDASEARGDARGALRADATRSSRGSACAPPSGRSSAARRPASRFRELSASRDRALPRRAASGRARGRLRDPGCSAPRSSSGSTATT